MVKLEEVFHSCSNPRVAEAALASMGGVVAANVHAAAARNGVADGAFVAKLMREFREHSCSAVVTMTEEAMRRSELPVLTGLQHILAHALIRRALMGQVEPAAMLEALAPEYA